MLLNEIVENTHNPLPISLVGWKTPFPKVLPFLHFLKISAAVCALPTCAKLSTPKSNAAPESQASFQTKPPSSAILMDISEEWESSKTYLPQISNN